MISSAPTATAHRAPDLQLRERRIKQLLGQERFSTALGVATDTLSHHDVTQIRFYYGLCTELVSPLLGSEYSDIATAFREKDLTGLRRASRKFLDAGDSEVALAASGLITILDPSIE